MKVTVIRPGELGQTEVARWRELQTATPSLDNPFLSVEFALALGRLRSYVRVAVIEDHDKVVGFMPFERHAFGVGKPLGSWLTTCHGLIAVPDLDIPARHLIRACGLSVFAFDHMVAGQPTWEPHESAVRPVPMMDLTGGYDAYIGHVRAGSPKNYKTVRYKERKLAREHGVVHLDWGAAGPDAMRVLTGWKSDQYRRTGRVDRFAQPWIVELLEEMHASDSPSFAGVLTMLYAGDTPVAGHFGLRTEKTLVGWFPAYDPEFARYSPGIMHHLHMAEQAASNGLGHVDMGKGGREYKGWLKNGTTHVTEGRVSRPSATAAVHWMGRTPVNKARNIVVDRPSLYRLADRLLKGFGRVRTSLQPATVEKEPSGAR
ncbi:polysaccharide biosynthesis protein CelD [Sphaerisporangium siamense]|uniref:CelD/BcsL family acetyltransferase involved in cellulose biosynthesis n=1 Tax=Sphaerisporangium siamense TaxID=795645 RepID=A0A7W7D7G6_9ACTN|nr:GNAT family N-acetyltransferase [Sphaerisporangium siamense]MBB4701713.1 CelD/BcsL family acetyltransferase involved in cellulose biosynthesis [Sphaerisporangium siamense]GII84383.1 polysaccharide biosynthesis protein CelD [Sphaerisporangium siamense]